MFYFLKSNLSKKFTHLIISLKNINLPIGARKFLTKATVLYPNLKNLVVDRPGVAVAVLQTPS